MMRVLVLTLISMFCFAFSLPTVAQTSLRQIQAIDPALKITINTKADADQTRDDLIDQIFGADGVSSPGTVTFQATFNPAGTTWAGNLNLARIEDWKVTVSRGFTSRMFRFVPTVYRNPDSGKGAIIVSAGHGHIGTYPPYQAQIQYFVASGYEVWTVDMPVNGLNAGPVTINDPVVGNVQVRNHDDMQVLKTPSFQPLRIFMEPVVAIVDDLHSRGITNIGMFGLSGGGWTTTLYAALDKRVGAAYSFAGTMPVFARSWSPPHNAIGDWEQREIPSLGVTYLDLYVLAAQDRRFMNIHNVHDDCCFGGTTASLYDAAVKHVVSVVGGSYDTKFDTTATSHTIGSVGANFMRADIRNWIN